MNAYFDFFNRHSAGLVRVFFAFTSAVDALFIYAAIFDRDLPRRLAERFFGALSGQAVKIAPSNEKPHWLQWLGFIFVSAVPPAAWIVFELYLAKRG
jgi:hypothetical protein